MEYLQTFDRWFIDFAKKYYSILGRAALFIIYFIFGVLKILGLSPADKLALGFAEHMGLGAVSHQLFFVLAIFECVIGVLILFPKLTRIAIFLMFLHMILVCSPLVLYPEAVYLKPFVPNLEGQYILKNAALVALALGLVAGTKPLQYRK